MFDFDVLQTVAHKTKLMIDISDPWWFIWLTGFHI